MADMKTAVREYISLRKLAVHSAIRRALALYVGGVFFDCQYAIAAKATTITISRIRYFFSILSNVVTVTKFLPNTSKHSRTSSSERAYTTAY